MDYVNYCKHGCLKEGDLRLQHKLLNKIYIHLNIRIIIQMYWVHFLLFLGAKEYFFLLNSSTADFI